MLLHVNIRLIVDSAYEGLTPKEIISKRKSYSLDSETAWDIWRDGCEDGEYAFPLIIIVSYPTDVLPDLQQISWPASIG